MKFTNLKVSRKCIFPIEDVAHVRLQKTFYHISVNFRNPGFRLVSKPQKPVFIFRTGPTTNGCEAGADPMGVRICRISQQCMCRKIFYLIKIQGQLININEVTDFHGGFLIFPALRSNTRWTTVQSS